MSSPLKEKMTSESRSALEPTGQLPIGSMIQISTTRAASAVVSTPGHAPANIATTMIVG